MKRENIRIRDPFVFTEEGKYYLLGTTGNDSWNKGSDLTLFVSDDLENFESCGTLVLAETLGEYTQIWAPELHKYNGNYYLIVSVFNERYGRGSILLTADTVKGPFTPLTGKYITPEGWWCLDATLFCKDGKPYLYFSNEWICTVTNDGDGSLFAAELSPDLKEIVGRPKKDRQREILRFFQRTHARERSERVRGGRTVRPRRKRKDRAVLVHVYEEGLLRRAEHGGRTARRIYVR